MWPRSSSKFGGEGYRGPSGSRGFSYYPVQQQDFSYQYEDEYEDEEKYAFFPCPKVIPIKKPTFFECLGAAALNVCTEVKTKTLRATDQPLLTIENKSTITGIPIFSGNPTVLTNVPINTSESTTPNVPYTLSTGVVKPGPGNWTTSANVKWEANSASESDPFVSLVLIVDGKQREVDQRPWNTSRNVTNIVTTSLVVKEGTTKSVTLGLDNRTGEVQNLLNVFWTWNKTA